MQGIARIKKSYYIYKRNWCERQGNVRVKSHIILACWTGIRGKIIPEWKSHVIPTWVTVVRGWERLEWKIQVILKWVTNVTGIYSLNWISHVTLTWWTGVMQEMARMKKIMLYLQEGLVWEARKCMSKKSYYTCVLDWYQRKEKVMLYLHEWLLWDVKKLKMKKSYCTYIRCCCGKSVKVSMKYSSYTYMSDWCYRHL